MVAAARMRGGEAALVDDDERGASPPATSRDDELAEVSRNVAAVTTTVAGRAGIEASSKPVADAGWFCLAGADFPQDDRRYAAVLRRQGWTAETTVLNDSFAILRAGTDRPWGVAVVCGFGTNCAGVAPNGRTYRLPARGTLSGDWGGGSEIGETALWYAVRAEDGRGDPTQLAVLVPAHFGLRRPRQVIEAMHFGRLPEERRAELAPLVFRAARSGDGIARAIVDRQADEVVTMAGAAIRRLRMTKLDVEVVLGGGVFRAEDPAFFDRIRAGVLATAPLARICVLTAPPVVGAALLGLDRLGAGAKAAGRVRGTLTDERLNTET